MWVLSPAEREELRRADAEIDRRPEDVSEFDALDEELDRLARELVGQPE
ncbi:MAG: hypothetical protein IKI50_01505 [Clostridia bacterium]|nr:hypothetical protein [Clostridia bacterium]